MATAKKTSEKFRVSCPFCGTAEENTLSLDLMDLDRIVCGGCDTEFSPRQALTKATEMVAAWAAVCRWIDMGREIAAE